MGARVHVRRLRRLLEANRDRYLHGRTPEPRIFDCFTFFNEVELLQFRIDYLKDVVDHFVIVEADRTFTGRPKPQNFDLGLVDESARDKIRYFFISFPENLPEPTFVSTGGPENVLSWKREGYQRVRLIDGLHDAQQDDIVVVTDLDEIPNRDRLREIKSDARIARRHAVVALEMCMFVYDVRSWASYADGRPFLWRHPKLTTMRNLVGTNSIRLSTPGAIVRDGGWHFSYFGGADRIRTKLTSYAHTEMNTPENVAAIEDRLRDRADVVGRESLTYSDTYDRSKLPDLVFSDKYREFFFGNP